MFNQSVGSSRDRHINEQKKEDKKTGRISKKTGQRTVPNIFISE
jgi:glutaredoxin